MSAPERVARAAKTIRTRWERGVASDPQTEAAQALEDTGQLLDPEVAADLVAFRKARELATLVAENGAFPVPVGPQPLSLEREQEIRSLDLLALMDDRVAPVISAHLAVLLAEIDHLRAQRDRRRDRLVALQNDALNMRGALSPMGEDRKVPVPLGPTLLPAVEWLIGRVAELEAELQADSCLCPPADQPGPHQVGCPQVEVPVAKAPERLPLKGVARLNASAAAAAEATHWKRLGVEDPHDGPLARSFRLGHDLPELGGEVRG